MVVASFCIFIKRFSYAKCVANLQTRRQPNCQKVDFLKFRTEITHVYLKKYVHPITGGGRPKSSKPLIITFHENIRYNDGLNCQKNTTKMCEKCNVKLHEQCFKGFHIVSS